MSRDGKRGSNGIISLCPMYGARERATQFGFQDCSGHFGTTRYNWGEKKNGFLAPKRRQMKHLDCVLLLVLARGSEVQILSPRPYLVDSVDSILAVSPSF